MQIRIKIKEEDVKLRKVKREAKRKRREREHRRQALKEVVKKHPDVGKMLKVRGETGRPRLEVDQPELSKTIVKVAMASGGADARRRSEAMQLIWSRSWWHVASASVGVQRTRVFCRNARMLATGLATSKRCP